MKKFFTLLSAAILTIGVYAQDLPQPSPHATVSQRFGLTDVTIDYSRPGVKGRTIFGDLLPFDKLWRTGANSATKITFSTDVSINGETIAAGTYSIFTIPSKESWKVMFNSDANASTGEYDQMKNAMEISVKPFKGEMTERLMFTFRNITDKSTEVQFNWASSAFKFTLTADPTAMAEKNIKAEMDKIDNAFGLYNSSARYYLDNKKDLDQALEWSKKSVEIKPMFWNVYTMSLIYEAKGDKANAIKAAEKSLKLAEEANYDVYIKLNQANLAKWK